MNRIYEVIWNKSKNSCSVVSEMAKNLGKTSGCRNKAVLAAMILSLLSAGGLAYAEDPATPPAAPDKKTPYFSVNANNSAKPAGTNWESDGAKGAASIAVGPSAGAQGDFSAAVGPWAKADGKYANAFGVMTNATGKYATAVGPYAKAVGDYTLAAGKGAKSTAKGAAAFGASAQAGGDQSSAFGVAANASGRDAIAAGSNTVAGAANASAFGAAANATGKSATAVGAFADASGELSLAAGDKAKASEIGASAFGTKAEASANRATALGYMAKAEGVYSLAAGYGSSATGEAAYAFGVDSKADGGDAIAIGSASEAQKDGGIAIGSTAIATQEFGVALGAGSIADRDAGVSGYLAGDDTSEAWQATVAAVAVGNEEEGFTRQITGVAAGTEDTDAVNVIQLKKLASNVNEQMTGLDTRITTNTEKITELGGRIGTLDTRVDRVGAGAAALAALHPLDYDPENKWDFAASYGHYSGANAVAIGAFYRPTTNTMFSVGGSFGGGENMLNVGFSMKVGQGTGISTSKIAMANEIKDLKTANERMHQENKFMQQENKEMKNEIEILKQQVQQLMATK